MKRTLILASLLAFTMATAIAAETPVANQPDRPEPPAIVKPEGNFKHPPKPEVFEKRLKLTEKQKTQAKELRQKGHEQMKPIMEQIKAKHDEADMVRKSKIVARDQKAQLDKIDAELRDLHRQAHELRMQNMKEFESILTKKQKKELAKIKKEGRKEFEKNHKRPPMFGPEFRPGFGPGPEILPMPPVRPVVK